MLSSLAGLQDLFSKGGINPTQIFTLLTGKASKKQVSEIVTPLLIKYTPYVGKAIVHKEAEHQSQVVFVLGMGENEQGKPVEIVTICTVSDQGEFEPKESFPLYELVNYIIKSIDSTEPLADAESPKQLSA